MEQVDALRRMAIQAQDVTWPFFAISTALVGIRMISRFYLMVSPVLLEDWLIIISWVLGVIRQAFFQNAINASLNVDPLDLAGTVPSASFWTLFADAWTYLSIMTPKLAIALLLIRFFNPPRSHTLIIKFISYLFVACSIVGFFLLTIECSPPAGLWDPYRYPNASCLPYDTSTIYSLVITAYSACLDIAFTVYPGVIIIRLRIPAWQKLSLMGLMGLGVASSVFAWIKFVVTFPMLPEQTIYQRLYHTLYIGIWNCIENDFVLIAACLPATLAFFRATNLYFTELIISIRRSSFSRLPSLRGAAQQVPPLGYVKAHQNSTPGENTEMRH